MFGHTAAALIWLIALQAPTRKVDDPLAPRVEIGARVNGVSGATLWAGASRTNVASFAWIEASCTPGAGEQEPARKPIAGWRFTTSVLRQEGDLVWINVEWQRQWSGSAAAPANRIHHDQLVVHVGDRVEIDRMASADVSGCSLADARLEATITRVKPAQDPRLAPPAAALGPTPKGGRGVGVGGGRDVGLGGRGVPAVAPRAAGDQATDPQRAGLAFNAELWLVHTLPNGREEVIQRRLVFLESGTEFSFPAVTIETPRGRVSVTVSVTVGATTSAGTPKELTLVLNRRVAGTEDPPASSVTGGSKQVLPWPLSTAVLGFELPSVKVSAGNELVGHGFAVRIRVATEPSPLREKRR